jgi:hypothetical protein
MSSFLGHTITGATIYFHKRQTSGRSWFWLFWLIVLAVFPDIEYGLLWFFGVTSSIRVTHSVVFCSILPVCTWFYLRRYSPQKTDRSRTLQAFGAAYSHLLLDVLVGVCPLPLLWPFTNTGFTLPFGILPSAGHLDLANPYLYRNAIIELGILVPLYSLVLLKDRIQRSQKRFLLIIVHVVIFVPFFVWGILLKR